MEWKAAVKVVGARRKHWDGGRAGTYVKRVDEMDLWLRSIDGVEADHGLCRKLAGNLVRQGFRHFTHLDRAVLKDVQGMTGPAAALTERAIAKATADAKVRDESWCQRCFLLLLRRRLPRAP